MEYTKFIKYFDISKIISKNKVQCNCPAHNDKQASLSITKNENNDILINCFAGCKTETILSKVNLTMKDLYNNRPNNKENKILEKTYIYTDEIGNNIHFTERYITGNNKSFLQGQFQNGNKVYNFKNLKRLYIYNYPAVIKAINKYEIIYFVEGEKDADNLIKLGFTATTITGGAKAWKKYYKDYFKGANLYVFSDNDEAGRELTSKIIDELKEVVNSIYRIDFNGKKEKYDVTDFLEENNFKKDIFKKYIDEYIEQYKISNIEITLNINDISIFENNNNKMFNIIYGEDGNNDFCYTNALDAINEILNIKTSIIKSKWYYFIYNGKFWHSIDKREIAKYFLGALKKKDIVPKKIDAILSLMCSDIRFIIAEDKWNSNPYLINLNNCTYDLKNYKAYRHKADDYLTYINDYNFDINAHCTNFTRSLMDYSKTRGIPDFNWILRFYEIAGYSLLGIMPFQKMFWFMGAKGRNGKGTVIRIIERLVGDFHSISSIDTRDLREKFYLSRLINKRLATAGDLHYRLANVSTLKSLSGGDRQTTDIKYGDATSFSNNAKFIFAMNQVPLLPDGESVKPIAKRIVALQFNYEIMTPDSDIESIFNKEISGIFNLAVRGLQRLMNNREFSPVKNADTWLENWASKLPPLEEFFSRYEYDNTPNKYNYDKPYSLFLVDIYEDYEKFMIEYYGKYWYNEQDITVKGSRKLKELLIDEFERRYNIILQSTKEYNQILKGSFTKILHIRDKIREFEQNLKLKHDQENAPQF